MRRIWLLLFAGAVAAADFLTKLLVVERLPLGSVRPVVSGWLNIVHFRNPGLALGLGDELGRALPWILTGASAIIAAVVLFSAPRRPLTDRWAQVGLHLVMGGAAGNILNRVTLGPVVDFLDVYVRTPRGESHWPAFNVADGAICAGVVMLLFGSWREKRVSRQEAV